MKKSTKKNAHKNNYNGRNIYGQRCIVKSMKLEKETAVEQCLEILADLEANRELRTEYTIDCTCFNAEECIELNRSIARILELRTKMSRPLFPAGDLPLPLLAV